MLGTSRLESVLRRCGVRGVLSQRLRACGKLPPLTEGEGCQSSGHASGLTIQLSQGQGRQPLVPKGAPPARGRATLKNCGVLVSAWHRTPGRCGCQPYCSFFSLSSPACACVSLREAPHGTRGDRRRLGSSPCVNTPTYILSHGRSTGKDKDGKNIWTRISTVWPDKSDKG